MNLLHIFGMNVRRRREELGISQERFAELCGLHRTYISDLERFQRNISINNIERIASALGVDAYILFMKPEESEWKN